MYESPDQLQPKYDAKGIETVRRDFCAAVPKILESTIKILFKTGDISRVRTYLLKIFGQFSQSTTLAKLGSELESDQVDENSNETELKDENQSKNDETFVKNAQNSLEIIDTSQSFKSSRKEITEGLGRISLQDYIISKEYRGRAGYKPRACVPSLEIAKRQCMYDPMGEPLVKERVPYVVIAPDQHIVPTNRNISVQTNALNCNPIAATKSSKSKSLTLRSRNVTQQHAQQPKKGTNLTAAQIPLIDLCLTPYEFLKRARNTATKNSTRLNAEYYITKQIIPPINRVFSLIGFDVGVWYTADMVKGQRIDAMRDLDLTGLLRFSGKNVQLANNPPMDHKRDTSSILPRNIGSNQMNWMSTTSGQKYGVITKYFPSSHCFICRQLIEPADFNAKNNITYNGNNYKCDQKNMSRLNLTATTINKPLVSCDDRQTTSGIYKNNSPLNREHIKSNAQSPALYNLLCRNCLDNSDLAAAYIMEMYVKRWQNRYKSLNRLCQNCTGDFVNTHIRCVSLDCPVFYHLVEASDRLSQLTQIKSFDEFFDQNISKKQ